MPALCFLYLVLLQIKELEEAKDAAIKQLLEYQSALAALASQRLLGFASEQNRVDERTPVKKAVQKASKSPKPKLKKTVEKADNLIVADKEDAVDAAKDVKPYQVSRSTRSTIRLLSVATNLKNPACLLIYYVRPF